MNRYERQLARAVYAIVLLAVLAMVVAEGAVVYLAIASLAAVISWPIAHGPSGQSAAPRWLVSVAVMLALLFFVFELIGNTPLISALAHFMVFVQVCKFFEAKRSRDYGQLIVLSMLEMVVAAILSTSMVYGLILLAYLGLTIYALLLFHFKREMELFERSKGRRGASLMAPAPGVVGSAAGTLDQIVNWRFFRLTATAGLFTLLVGALLFLCFPRVGSGMLGRAELPTSSHLSGFADSPRLGDIGHIKESNEVAMWVTVREQGRSRALSAPLLLRGSVCWRYRRGRWHSGATHERPQAVLLDRGLSPNRLAAWGGPLSEAQEIIVDMGPIDAPCLFAPYPPLAIQADARLLVHHALADQTLIIAGGTANGLRYSVWTAPQVRTPAAPVSGTGPAAAEWPRLRQLAQQWTVGLSDPYAKAQAIQDRLQAEYRYSLEMLAPPPGSESLDPLEVFLFETKAGHCQYFASAMTVLCQQLGLPARMISGFKVVEYNAQGGHYIVRQRHAHSWVEVHLPDQGWVSFDPTPAAGDDSFQVPTGLIGWLTHTFDFINHRWQQRVLHYSNQDRLALLSGVGSALKRLAAALRGWTGLVARFLTRNVLAVLIGIGLAVLVFHLAARLALRRVRRGGARGERRARRAGGGFWSDLLAMLKRRRIHPAAALTPLEIARQLEALTPQVAGLADLAVCHYKVFYGDRPLDAVERDRVDRTLAELALALRPRRAGGRPSS